MKKITLIISTFWALNCAIGQVQEGGTPESFNFANMTIPTSATILFSFYEIQIKAINDTVYDVGVAEIVNINFVSQSNKFITSEGIKIYRLIFEVENTLGLVVDFSNFYLPTGSKLYAYNEDKTIKFIKL